MHTSVAPRSTASSDLATQRIRRSENKHRAHRARRLNPQNAQPTMQTFVKFKFRFTT